MNIHCFKCRRELEKPGALVFGLPNGRLVMKYHVCVLCWPALLKWLDARSTEGFSEHNGT